MEATEFRKAGKEMVDYIADYLENIRDRQVLPTVEPGYVRDLIPDHPPEKADSWEDVKKDIERVIMPGVAHWQSPHFHAYFPANNSYSSILADMLSDAIGCIGFSWISCPACTDLEVVMMDWLGKMIQLPPAFLSSSGGKGGGVIQGTACEATLMTLLSAKARTIGQIHMTESEMMGTAVKGKLVAYASAQSHSSIERAGFLGGVKIRLLETDDNLSLRGDTLQSAIDEDKAKENIPFYVVATLGTTSSCAYDNLTEIGQVCEREGIWLHVDAAYAGSAFVCPEFRPLLDGVEYAESYNFNPHKWMLVNFDCSAMWVKNENHLIDAFVVDSLYLKHEKQERTVDYRHWQIPLSRRFRSLKLWFVMRLYGVQGIQRHIRGQVALAHQFEAHVRADELFEVVFPVTLGLVCFRLKGPNEWSEILLKRINKNGKIHMIPAELRQTFIIRFVVGARTTTCSDIDFAWQEIKQLATKLLEDKQKK